MSESEYATIIERLDKLGDRLRRLEIDRTKDDDSSLLDVEDVAHMTTLSVREVWRRAEKEEGFPKPRKVGEKRRAWRKAEVARWTNRLPQAPSGPAIKART